MSDINPITRLYKDIETICKNMIIKYSYKAETYETLDVRINAENYMSAYMCKDTFFTYDEYSEDDFRTADPTLSDELIYSYMNDLSSTPIALQSKLLTIHRVYVVANYEEWNEYYRILNGLPPLDDTDFIYISDEIAEKYKIDKTIPIHLIQDKLGDYYITLLDGIGYINTLIEKYPTKEYLKYLGKKRISIYAARNAKNFAILYLDQSEIMDSTYRDFIYLYEQARTYFTTVVYVTEYRGIISNYDNFIALCIFIMAVQQLSVKALKNAVDREFYDDYLVQMLYETYGLPYNSRIDSNTQKQIVQNINLLIQNKATDKVIVDIASILGFNNIEIYEYYLMKKRLFDDNGRPIFKTKTQVNPLTGDTETVHDYSSMFDVYFQRVLMDEKNMQSAFSDDTNKVSYYDVVSYDPFWWEDDELNSEIWEKEYNIMETKYIGLSIPYRLSELIFQSVYLLRMIEDKYTDLSDPVLSIPKITASKVSLIDLVVFLSALLAKQYNISGKIYSSPSQIMHVLEVLDQEINHEYAYNEVLGFDFDMFKPENIKTTKSILESYLVERDYVISNGHDVDIQGNGVQNTFGPTQLVRYEEDKASLNEFEKYLLTLSATSLGTTKAEKRDALNNMYKDMKNLYHFLSYRLGVSQDVDEMYAIKKFYDTAFYTQEIANVFKTDYATDKDITYMDYLKKNNTELYDFVNSVDTSKIYTYIDHAIYAMEDMLDDVSYLYFLNNSVSPIQELLLQLINFFKSYTTDIANFSSIMVVDWRMENMIKLIDKIPHMSKTIGVRDELFGTNYNDFVKKFTAKIMLDDSHIYLSDSTAISCKIHSDETITLDDLNKMEKLSKTIEYKETLMIDDTIAIGTHVNLDDDLKLYDKVAVIH